MRTVVCRGGSMRPFLRPGDRVAVEPVDPATVRRGQIVVFRGRGGEEIIHRVVSTTGGIVTRGDNGRAPDGVIAPERIVGRAVGRRIRGRLVGFTRLQELWWLACSRPAHSTRRAVRAVLGSIAPVAYPVLPVRTVVFSEGENVRAIAAFLFRLKIAARRCGPAGERVWIHPVFHRTALGRRLQTMRLSG